MKYVFRQLAPVKTWLVAPEIDDKKIRVRFQLVRTLGERA